MAVWQQGDSNGLLSIWANRYDAVSGWGTATLIENNSGAASLPQVGMDNAGNAVAVWVQNDGTLNRMWANRYVAGQGWGTSQVIETNPGDADFPRVAVNGDGNAMALWKQFNGVSFDIWASRFDVGSGRWRRATLMETSSEDASEPWVALDNSGNAMAVWRQSDGVDPNPSIWASRFNVGTGHWGTPTLIEPNPGFASFPHVEFDDGGNAIVVWYQSFGEADGTRHIWANRYVVGSGWGTPTRLDSYAQNGQGPSLAVNGAGNAMAVWRQWDDQGVAISIWANRYDVGSGSWGTATLIETGSGAADTTDVAMDSNGNATAVWKQFDGTFDSIYANRYVAGQGWGTAALIETQTDAADNPKVETDGNGNAIAVWQQQPSIWANRFANATATGTTFTDVTLQAGFPGFTELNSSWCVSWADYDGDGFIDIITLGHVQDLTGSISQLWHNNGDGTFTDATFQAGLDPHNGDAHGAVWADFDNDGHLDLFVAKGTVKTDPIDYDDLWRNNGDGTFTNIAASAGVISFGRRNRGAAAVDYNNDSFLDIFVTSFQRPSNGGRNLLYRSNGDLTFTDVAEAAGLHRPRLQNRTCAWTDFDGDGLVDVFITQI